MATPTIVSASVRITYRPSGATPLIHGVITTPAGRWMMVLCDRIVRLEMLGDQVEGAISCARCLRELRKMGRA